MIRDFTKERFDIIIQAGQSNSEGYGFGPADQPYIPNDEVFYLNADFSISQACERVTGNEIQTNFSLAFAQEYMNHGCLEKGRKLLILRAAVGGTGFLDKHWGLNDDLYLRMMQMIRDALELNPENRLVALLWHQGETDAEHHASYEGHYNNLMSLVKSVKETFGVANLPFIAADFVQQWKNNNIEICTPVVDAIRSVCRDCTCGGFVETDGLLSNLQELHRNPLGGEDTIHFSRKATYELGRRYFTCYLNLSCNR